MFNEVQSQIKSENRNAIVTKMSSMVNCSYDDYASVISPDGLVMYFTSRRPVSEKEKKNGLPSKEFIYVSNFNTILGKWSEAQIVQPFKNVTRRKNISAIALSNEGKKMLLFQDDIYGYGDIYESSYDGKEWTNPEKFSDSINSQHHESSASFSPDGNTLYFISNRPKGYGGTDIWYSTKDLNGTWNTPINMGKIINTNKDEECVFAHSDGKTLYFSSKGHQSIGGYDIYKCSWDELTKTWLPAVNIGIPINTKSDDVFYMETADHNKAFYTTVDPENPKKDKDIFEVIYSNDFIKKKMILLEKKLNQLAKFVTIKGKVCEEITKNPISSIVSLYYRDSQREFDKIKSDLTTGGYQFRVDSIGKYSIHAFAKGFTFYSDSINVNLKNTKELEIVINKKIMLNRSKIGESFLLNNLLFEIDKSVIIAESIYELNKLTEYLKENSEFIIEISITSENVGAKQLNESLLEDRLITVKNYIVSHGIVEARIKLKNKGDLKPIIGNNVFDGIPRTNNSIFKIVRIK